MSGRYHYYRKQYQCGNDFHVLEIKLVDSGPQRGFSNLGTDLETEEWVGVGN